MVSVGSLPVAGETVFDLETQSGIALLLASIRASEIPSSQKSELRDLVFTYTNGGKDQSVRLLLEQKLSAAHIQLVAKKVVAEESTPQPKQTPVNQIGKFRAAPSFAVRVPVISQSNQEVPAPANVEPVPVIPVPVPPAPIQEAVPPVVSPEPLFRPAPVEVSAPAPAPVVVEESIPVPPVMKPLDDTQYLDRIREIKASVNEKVGNPVNLVDIDNAVGREYMAALLDAMKKINTGSSAGSAMARLETAYAAVLEAIKHHNNPEPEPALGGPQSIIEEPLEATISETQPHTEFTPIQVQPDPQVSYPDFNEEPAPVPVEHESHQFAVPEEPLALHQETVSDFGESPQMPEPPVVDNIPVQPHKIANEGVSGWDAPQSVPIGQPTHPHAAAAFAPLSQAKEKPLSIDDLPTTPVTRPEVSADSALYEKEIDDGLQQLLTEWPIFKKSGLFGTGPKGKDHPLFKKMAPLHIPLLLAGRFEGATQEIKQSITDYMNGWRYEQGLIYQQGETFEHYLRRVIRHIIDLQKG